MANEIALKPTPSILVGRFKALLRQRDGNIRASSTTTAPPYTSEDIVRNYELLLSELTSNVKPVITDLTIIAGQQRQHAEGIAGVICTRILEVTADKKLPSLYLLDSIVKNFAQEYVGYFSLRLPEVFCEAYSQVQPTLHSAMRHLFGTWSKIFPPSVLHMIEAQLQLSQADNNQPSNVNPLMASESPQPTQGIHVNPKYLRQREHSSLIIDSVGGERLNSTGTMHQFVATRLGRSSSPSRTGFQTSMTYNLSNGQQRQSPRALIDAYGSDKSHGISGSKPLLVEGLDRNGIENKVLSTSWQNTEEEEFDWEDMSPKLVDHCTSDGTLQSTINLLRERPVILASNATSLDQHRKGGSGGSQLPLVDDSFVVAEDSFASSAYGRVSPCQVSVFQNQINPSLRSGQHLDTRKMSIHQSNTSQHPFNIRVQARNLLMPPNDNFRNTDVNPYGTHPAVSRLVPGLNSNMEAHPPVLQSSFKMRPSVNMHTARPPSLNPIFPSQKRLRTQFEAKNANNSNVGHGPNKSLFMHEQPFSSVENKDISKGNLYPLPDQPCPISSNQQNHGQAPQQQFLPSQGPAVMRFPLPGQSIANISLHLRGGTLQPSYPGRPPAPPQMIRHPNASPFVTSQRPTSAYSYLISSLMAQGVISMTKQPPLLDSVGTDFNPDVRKVRHESAVHALYGDLPRQCRTCGLRFKSQDEHSSHMDWHVTKNRMSKNSKQKPSRKWFVSERMWLSGAQALGTESVPGFLPTETMVQEKKEDEELAVPAEEDQNKCALCGEPFDEFYSEEMEEWMYRGAVYLNATEGTKTSMDRSQLGAIVHAKCRYEPSMTPSKEFGLDERGINEEGSQRKRMRRV